MKVDKNGILRLLITIAAGLAVIGLVYLALNSVLPGFFDVLAHGDGEEMQQYLRAFNNFDGYLVGFSLQFVQIITIIMPSVPIQLAMGFVFGTWRGFLICYIGYVGANAAVFIVSRKFGDAIGRIFPNKREKISKGKGNIILASKYPAFTVFIASIIPLIPNGVIPYVASKTKIKIVSFIVSVAIGCIPTVLTLCAIGGELHGYDLKTAILLILPLLAFVGILLWQKNRLISIYEKIVEKNKKTDDDTKS